MRRSPFSLLVLAAACSLSGAGACASARPAQREALADGSHRLSCKATLSECLAAVGPLCGALGYDVLRGTEKRTRIGPEPWPAEQIASDAVVRCRQAGGSEGAEAGAAAAAPAPVVPAAAPGAPTSPARPGPGGCFPGATQSCVGPGGCAGGQVCSPEGTSFGPCDCGTAAPPPPTNG